MNHSSEPKNEEVRLLLRRIVESMAWRQLMSINILGHCLKFVFDLDNKVRVASELDLSLRLFHEVRSLYRELGWKDLESVVRDKLDRIPYPQSRLEFGVAYYVTGLAEGAAMKSYAESSYPQFAAIALAYVDAAKGRPEPTRFIEFASDPTNRPQAQQYLNTWLGIALPAFGRPNSAASERVVELGLRSQTPTEMIQEFVASLQPLLERSGLRFPDAQSLGLELPGGLLEEMESGG